MKEKKKEKKWNDLKWKEEKIMQIYNIVLLLLLLLQHCNKIALLTGSHDDSTSLPAPSSRDLKLDDQWQIFRDLTSLPVNRQINWKEGWNEVKLGSQFSLVYFSLVYQSYKQQQQKNNNNNNIQLKRECIVKETRLKTVYFATLFQIEQTLFLFQHISRAWTQSPTRIGCIESPYWF